MSAGNTPTPAPAPPKLVPPWQANVAAVLIFAMAALGLGLGGYQIYEHFRPTPSPTPDRPLPADPECEPCRPQPADVHARGHRTTPNLAHLRALSFQRHGRMLQALPPATEHDFDSRHFGWVGPVKNQGQCGSCWDFSGTGIVEIAYNKAGVGGGPNSFILSEQYTLSCGRNGGCGGDDNTTVLAWAKATGLPLSADYGPYTASAGLFRHCNYKASEPLYKIPDWGFADSNGGQGVTPVADIKAAIKAYGAVGCGIAANRAFESWGNNGGSPSQPFRGGGWGQHSINHDIILVGWHDYDATGQTGYWILRNSWGTGWGDKGYCYIEYGANDVGTEAVFAMPPDNPNPPAPGPQPDPNPPGPPGPGPSPIPITITGKTTVPCYGMVQLAITGGIVTSTGWTVFPDRTTGAKVVTSYTAPGGASFLFSGQPGIYEVGAYTQTPSGVQALQTTVTIESGKAPAPTPPTPPGPSPYDPRIDPAFVPLGRAYQGVFSPAYAAAWDKGAAALEAGQTLTQANAIVGKDWNDARIAAFKAQLSPSLDRIVPETTPDSAVTPEQKAALAKAWRGLAAGLRYP